MPAHDDSEVFREGVGGADAADARRRSERRAAVRAHHPDAGGAPGALQDALRAVDAAYDRRGTTYGGPEVGAQADRPRTPRTVLRDGVRRVRERIPVGWPGHRRLIDVAPRPPRATDA